MFFSLCRRYADALAWLALALVCAVVFWPLWHGQTYYLGDLQLYFLPMASQWKAALAAGRVPLWNGGILAGTPFVGNPQMWVLYPASLLLLVFPAVEAVALTTLLHFWLAGAFFYGWMRRGHLNLHPVAALLGACAWMLCGFLVAKTQFPNMFMAIAWIPAVLWAGEAVVLRADARATLILALALALQTATAHAQISLFTLYMLAAHALYLWQASAPAQALVPAQASAPAQASVPARAERRFSGWRVVALMVGALLLMGLLTLGQTLPVFDTVRAAMRQNIDVVNASRFVVVPWALVTLVWPYFYGNPMTGAIHYPRVMALWETVAYLGIVPLLLAGVASAREGRARFWWRWSLVFLWLSMGTLGGLYLLAYYLLPGLNRFHDAARFLAGYSLGVAVLAALGAHWAWNRGARGRVWVALALLLTVADAGYFARHFYPVLPRAAVERPPLALWGSDALLARRQARLFNPNQGEIWETLQNYNRWRVADRENTRRLYEIAPYNRHLLAGWLADPGYEPLYDRNTRLRIAALSWKPTDTRFDPRLAAQLGRLSIRSLQLFRAQPLPPTPDLKLVYTTPWRAEGKRLYIYRNERCLPRARFQGGRDQSGRDQSGRDQSGRDQGGNWQMARIVSEDTRSIQLEVPARATVLELADTMRPGWSATVDGQRVPIEQTAEGFRRLQLPPASPIPTAAASVRRIDFEYRSMPWKLGVFVSLCALGFTTAAWAATRRRRS